jgi:hypothetical protein
MECSDLSKCRTHDSITAKTSNLLQRFYVLLNTINYSFSSKPNLYQPKSSLVVTIKLEFLALGEMSY